LAGSAQPLGARIEEEDSLVPSDIAKTAWMFSRQNPNTLVLGVTGVSLVLAYSVRAGIIN
jgi:hypothetical protein